MLSYVDKRLSTFRCRFFVVYVLIGVLAILSPEGNAHAGDVTLTWNANTETDLAGYRVFQRAEGVNYSYSNPRWQGTATTCTISNLDDSTTYYFVARAYDTSGNESADSDEVTCYRLLVSTSSNRSNSVVLKGQTVRGNIYAFTNPDNGVSQVTYYLDDPSMSADPYRVDALVRYDFAGTAADGSANPFATTTLANGTHQITSYIQLSSGGTQTLNASFTVANPINVPPLAEAGPDQNVSERSAMTLDGSSSSDSDGIISSYGWVQIQGADVTLSNPKTAEVTFVAPEVGSNGATLVFELEVIDNRGLKDTDTVSILVSNVNRPAVLAPIGARSADEGTQLSFTVTGTDPDGDVLTYSATNLPLGATFDTHTNLFSWTPEYGTSGNYIVTFTVTDNCSPAQSDSEQVTITVGDVNRPPVLAPIGARSADEGTQLSFTVTGTDPDGDVLTYSAESLPSGATFDVNSRQFNWTPGHGTSGNYIVTFTVTDNCSPAQSDSEQVTIMVGDVNRPPIADAGPDQTVNEGDLVTLDGSNSSAADGKISLKWTQTDGPEVILAYPFTDRPWFKAPEVGEGGAVLIFDLTATDNGGLVSIATCIVNVLWIDNRPAIEDLVITGSPFLEENTSHQFTATVSFGDGTTQVVTDDVDWEEDSPYATMDRGGLVSVSDVDEDKIVTVLARYRYGNVTQTTTRTVSILNIPDSNQSPSKPTIVSPYNGQMQCVLQPVITADSFSDPDGDKHKQTQWQIGVTEDMSQLLLDITSPEHLTSITIPHTLLDGDATYYVRLRFYDSYANPSEWSDSSHFTTMNDVGDLDNNGIPDEQDVGYDTDLNGDGIADIEQPETIKAAHYGFADVTIGVEKASNSVTSIEAIETIEPSTVFETRFVEHMVERNIVNPRSFVYGLFSYRIAVDRPGATAMVTMHFSCEISRANKFFKFDTVNGWQDYSEHTTFGKNGRSITLDLQDGGYGDSDGVANGTILDPGGLFEEDSDSSEISLANSANGSSTGGGCFIATTEDNFEHSQSPTHLHPALVATVAPLIAIRDVLVGMFGATGTSVGLCLASLILACLLKADGAMKPSETRRVKRSTI